MYDKTQENISIICIIRTVVFILIVICTRIPEEGRRAHRPKRCTDNNEDDDNTPNNTNNTNHQASSQKLKEIIQKKIIYFPESPNHTNL